MASEKFQLCQINNKNVHTSAAAQDQKKFFFIQTSFVNFCVFFCVHLFNFFASSAAAFTAAAAFAAADEAVAAAEATADAAAAEAAFKAGCRDTNSRFCERRQVS